MIPNLWWQNETIEIRCDLGDVTSGTFYATYVGPKLVKPASDTIYKITQRLTKKDNQFQYDYQVPEQLALGEYNWQIWSNKGRTKTPCFNGTFQIVAGLQTRTSDPTTRDEKIRTSLEIRLDEVENAIRNIVKSGAQSYSLAGNQTVRVALNELRTERQWLMYQVNLERRERGLPFIRGTVPHTTYYNV